MNKVTVITRGACVVAVAAWFGAGDSVPARALSQESPNGQLVRIDGQRINAALVSVTSQHISYRSGDRVAPEPVTWDEFVRWSHPIIPRAGPQVLLTGGSSLVAADDWSGQGVVKLNPETLEVTTSLFGPVAIPRDRVRGLLLQPHDEVDQYRIMDEVDHYQRPHDRIMLMNGDRLTGTVKSLDRDEIRFDTAPGEIAVPIDRIVAVAFNSALLQRPDSSNMFRAAVGLKDGSLIYPIDMQANSDACELQLFQNLRLRGRTIADIVALQSLGNVRFVYLSDLQVADYRHIPYLDVPWPLSKDRKLVGGPLQTGNALYLKGLAMHSAARATYLLNGSYSRFLAEVALDDAAGRLGSVVFRVYCVRHGKRETAYESDVMRGGDPPQLVNVDVSGAQGISLVVDYADRGDELDHANWLDARLIK